MSYTSGHQREVLIATGASTASLAVIGLLTPGIFKHKVRAVALIFTTAAAAAGILLVKLRPTPGSSSGESTVATLNFDGTTGAAGKGVFVDGLDIDVSPGQQLAFEITDVAASGVVEIKALVEDNYDAPSNFTDLSETV